MNKYDELIERAKRFTDTAIVGELINAISELKDREDVVRCKDCEHCDEHLKKNGEVYFYRCGFFDIEVEADDFCSYGGRKEDGAGTDL